MATTGSQKKPGSGCLFLLFLLLDLSCFAAALFCMVASILGWLQYGDWLHPGWTIASTFGVDHTWFADMQGMQKIITAIMPMNAGWGFLSLGVLGFFVAPFIPSD